MFTSDLALIRDPHYLKISQRFHDNPDQFADAFARAWYKLTHRDMGPITKCVGSMVPDEVQIWQDPVPVAPLVPNLDNEDGMKAALVSRLTISQLVRTAWSSASTWKTQS